jgi:enamine deaminase RidA (YjgF/YER057c/UK114 family)
MEKFMADREAVYIEGFKHTNPIPNAARIGNILVSGALMGRDSRTGQTAEGIAAQTALVFRHMREVVEEAGGTTDDIVKVNIALRDHGNREALNAEWVRMFADEATRPARQTTPLVEDGPFLIHLDFMAVLDTPAL